MTDRQAFWVSGGATLAVALLLGAALSARDGVSAPTTPSDVLAAPALYQEYDGQSTFVDDEREDHDDHERERDDDGKDEHEERHDE